MHDAELSEASFCHPERRKFRTWIQEPLDQRGTSQQKGSLGSHFLKTRQPEGNTLLSLQDQVVLPHSGFVWAWGWAGPVKGKLV